MSNVKQKITTYITQEFKKGSIIYCKEDEFIGIGSMYVKYTPTGLALEINKPNSISMIYFLNPSVINEPLQLLLDMYENQENKNLIDDLDFLIKQNGK